jgi:tetraacyldisaccharide 4'-kinase
LLGGGVLDNGCVISVGNLTVGGTGKTVVASFLVEHFGARNCAILLRGYGRGGLRPKNLVVSDGGQFLVDVTQAGDEAMMLAQHCGCPVVVGADRKRSYMLLLRQVASMPRYIILDDAYQNHQLKKNCEILLLDARAPFDNGHCLPAGRLREMDYRRAHIIMLTHADGTTLNALSYLKKQLLRDFPQTSIVAVKHAIGDFLCANKQKIGKPLLHGKRFLLFAGIGSFGNFVQSVEALGVGICKAVEFSDHYMYRKQDIQFLISLLDKYRVDGALTTAKDWVKIEELLKKDFVHRLHDFFVVPVSLEFLSSQDYRRFVVALQEKISPGMG